MRPRSWPRVRLSAGLVAFALAGVAHAGNDEGFLLGNQAALAGGAVTSSVHEGSAVWYNPAGLA
ncbi:MAG: hypothetical protein FJ104_13625, partial [Deltaproteobacteria bacterium]|nr:hypothetical protein [Deltaproteobacteria bacterium]